MMAEPLLWRRRKVYFCNKGKTLLPPVFPSNRSINYTPAAAKRFDGQFLFLPTNTPVHIAPGFDWFRWVARDRRIKKGPAVWQSLSIFPSLIAWSGRSHVRGAWAFLALANLELHLLVFFQSGITSGFNLGMVDKQIVAPVIRCNKTISLACIEPFYCTCTHCYFSLALFGLLNYYLSTLILWEHTLERSKNTPHKK